MSLVTDEKVADAVLTSQAAGVKPERLIAHDQHLPTYAEHRYDMHRKFAIKGIS